MASSSRGWFPQLLTRLWPSRFRATYGADAGEALDRLLAEERAQRGRAAACLLWMRAVADVIVTALREHRLRFDLPGRLGPLVTQSWRRIRHAPGMSLAVIATLALGIGSVSAVFTLADPMIFRPLPYPDADRIVVFKVSGKEAFFPLFGDLVAIRDQSHTLEALSTAVLTSISAYRDGTDSTRGQVTGGFLTLTGATAAAGHLFRDDEYPQTSKDRSDVVMLTWPYWQRAFGGRADITEQTITIDEYGTSRRYRIAGVLSRDFVFPDIRYRAPDLIMPDRINWELATETRIGPGGPMARLRPGITIAQADAELQHLFGQTEQLYPKYPQGRTVHLRRLQDELFGDVRTPLLMLFGGAGCLLLLACVNLAHFMGARLATRTRELALRQALGAARARVVQQLMIEAAPLALAGGGAGLLLGQTLIQWGISQTGEFSYVYRVMPVTLSLRVAVTTGLLTLGTFFFVGVWPAWRAVRGDVRARLAHTSGRRRGWMRVDSVVTAVQAGVAVAVVVVSVLILRSFIALQRAPTGIQPMGLWTLQIPLPSDQTAPLDLRRRLADALARVPGVATSSVTGMGDLPPTCNRNIYDPALAEVAPYPGGPKGVTMAVRGCTVDDRVMAAEQMHLETGRNFTPDEAYTDAPVAIVDRRAADVLWPGRDPLGETVWNPQGRARTVIGVVSTLQWNFSDRQEPAGKILLPLIPTSPYQLHVLRSTGFGSLALGDLQAAVRQVDEHLLIRRLGPPVEIERAVGQARFLAAGLGILGAVTMLLAIAGVFAVVSHFVSTRTREIGVRIALGADRARVRGHVVMQALVPAIAGIAFGLTFAFWWSSTLKSVLAKVAPHDVTSFVLAALGTIAVVVIGSLLPARRASRVDPIAALRAE